MLFRTNGKDECLQTGHPIHKCVNLFYQFLAFAIDLEEQFCEKGDE
jgi:hypothetical protein